ncbi:MAG: alpha/beta hydrolase [Gammaproteobacteria bacterium]|nr:alpha/beta hydrolase [Gammaproteobacteria bacterium]MCP5458387.1 alpha/beta hydrolase [Gammaproteobacteria bacterium]
MPFLTVNSRRIEYKRIEAAHPADPTLVMLHEGLGSIAMWRDFPDWVAKAARCNVLVYSRYGYGWSDPLTSSRAVDFMHEEALQTLPALLEQLEISQPILLGHSDGASIALIHAGGADRPVTGVIVMAPHVMVEDISITSIQAARQTYLTTDLRDKLSRYHADVDSAFWGWNDIWLHPDFRAWNIEEYLPRIRCPILAIQGEDDEYGTLEQIDRIARQAPDADLLKLQDCRHSPHRDQPQAVITACAHFIDRLRTLDGASGAGGWRQPGGLLEN